MSDGIELSSIKEEKKTKKEKQNKYLKQCQSPYLSFPENTYTFFIISLLVSGFKFFTLLIFFLQP